jgi:EAL domain-containing protein (putative c-di-GMP-specific phosphodiesterase class I)
MASQAQNSNTYILVCHIEHPDYLQVSENLHTIEKELNENGSHLALDDYGCGFSDMITAEILRPKLVKFCISIITSRVGRHPQIEQDIHTAVHRLSTLGCAVSEKELKQKNRLNC